VRSCSDSITTPLDAALCFLLVAFCLLVAPVWRLSVGPRGAPVARLLLAPHGSLQPLRTHHHVRSSAVLYSAEVRSDKNLLRSFCRDGQRRPRTVLVQLCTSSLFLSLFLSINSISCTLTILFVSSVSYPLSALFLSLSLSFLSSCPGRTSKGSSSERLAPPAPYQPAPRP